MRPVHERLRGTALAKPKLAYLGLLLCLVFVALAVPLTRPEEWIGWLPTTLGAAESGAVWTSVLTCAAGAWMSGQPQAHGFDEWARASPRGRAARVLPAFVAVTSAALMAQAFSLATILMLSAAYGLAGWSLAGDMLLTVPTLSAYLLFWSAAGAILGLNLRRAVAIPLAGVLPYFVFGLFAIYARDGPLGAFAVGDGRVFDYIRPTTTFLVSRALFWITAAAFCSAWLLSRMKLRAYASWAVSLTAAALLLQGPAFDRMPSAVAPVCDGVSPAVCTDGAHATVLPRYAEAVERLWSATPRALRPVVVGSDPTVVPILSAGQPVEALVVPPERGFTSPARLIDRTAFAGRWGDELFLAPCFTDGVIPDSAYVLVLWWRTALAVPIDGTAFIGDLDYTTRGSFSALPNAPALRLQAAVLTAMSDSLREAWFADNAAAIRSCAAIEPLAP